MARVVFVPRLREPSSLTTSLMGIAPFLGWCGSAASPAWRLLLSERPFVLFCRNNSLFLHPGFFATTPSRNLSEAELYSPFHRMTMPTRSPASRGPLTMSVALLEFNYKNVFFCSLKQLLYRRFLQQTRASPFQKKLHPILFYF